MAGTFNNTTGELTSSFGNSGTSSASLSVIQPDSDSDGIPDSSDNCIDTQNFDQADQDSDNIGDACDQDIDGDGIDNYWETRFGLDPTNPTDRNLDPDSDGFTNIQEFGFNTNPNVANLDNNGNSVPDIIDKRRRQSFILSIVFPLLVLDE